MPRPRPSHRAVRPRSRAFASWAARFALCLVPVIAFDAFLVQGILEATGGLLCPILDDAFIHFHYARSFADLHPLSYHPGDPATTGATSMLYPALLAIGLRVGFEGMGIAWFAHGLSVVFVAAAMVSAWRLGELLVHPAAGPVAALGFIASPTFLLFCLGGMEIGVSSALHFMATAGAVAWIVEPERWEHRTAWSRAGGLTLLGGLAALGRPEGAAAACAVALALLVYPPRGSVFGRALGALAVLPAALPGAVAFVTTGSTRTNGMQLKFLPANPYLSTGELVGKITRNWQTLWNTIFAGKQTYDVVYPAVPTFFRALVVVGGAVFCLRLIAHHRRRGALAAVAWLGATVALFFPLLYVWLGNLGRYVFAFMPMLTVPATLAAAGLVHDLTSPWRRFARVRGAVAGLAGAGMALAFVSSPLRARAEHVDAARQMCGQQVAMAQHVRALPEGAIVALNDAGAIAYLGERTTWDMVGLTSFDAAGARLAGVGSIFERMERLPPERRPTHVALYHSWFPDFDIMGRHLARSTVDGRYVGSPHKDLYEIRTELFDSGRAPLSVSVDGALVDELDIADLRSEAEHGYRASPMRSRSASLHVGLVRGQAVADGGRPLGDSERFTFAAEPSREARWVMRIDARGGGRLEVSWNGSPLPPVIVPHGASMAELVVVVPAERVRAENTVERHARAQDRLFVQHDWLYQ